ncbi:MAG TPA: hypothetical protein VGA47_00930 [Candidatus Dormibacteraeota bacterium]
MKSMMGTWAGVAVLGLVMVAAVALDLWSAGSKAGNDELRLDADSTLLWVVRLMGGTPKWR